MTTSPITELLQRTTSLRALARELVGEADADDVLQEAAIQSITSPPRRPGPTQGWLAAVVRNLARNHRRAQRTRSVHESRAARPEELPADRQAEDADTLRQLTEVVTSLPEPYRGTILARYLREQTPSEIAAATDTPVSTVKTRLDRGLRLLRERLDEQRTDWRGAFVTTFALTPGGDPAAPSSSGITMKLTILAVALLPLGLGLWASLPDDSSTPSHGARPGATPLRASGDSVAPAGRARPGDDSTPRASRESGRARTASLDAPRIDEGGSVASTRAAARSILGQIGAAGGSAAPPLVRLDVVGPRAFRDAFGGTNVGSLLGSAAGEKLWRPLLAPFEQMWRGLDGGADFAATRQRVLDYAGRIRVMVSMDQGEADEPDRVSGVFALEPDGETNLSELAGDLARSMEALVQGSPETRLIAEHELRSVSAGGEFVTMPTVLGSSLVAFFGKADSMDEAVARGLQALAGDDEPPPEPISLRIDLAQLAHTREMRTNPPLVRAFGLESLEALTATLRPAGGNLQLETEIAFGDGERGIFDAFFPRVSSLPALLDRVPERATPWLVVPLRLDTVYRVAIRAAADFGGEDIRQENYEELGFHVDTDLLDHLGGELMLLGDLWRAEDSALFEEGGDPALGACLALSVADHEAFGRGFAQLLEALKGMVHEHESREVNGVTITRLGTMIAGAHLALGPDLAALAFGEEGVDQLEALIARSPQQSARPLPPPVDNVRHLAPDGWNGAGLAKLSALFGGQVTLVLEMLEDSIPPQMGFEFSTEETQAVLEGLVPMLLEYDLDHIVTLTGHHDGHWRMRIVW